MQSLDKKKFARGAESYADRRASVQPHDGLKPEPYSRGTRPPGSTWLLHG